MKPGLRTLTLGLAAWALYVGTVHGAIATAISITGTGQFIEADAIDFLVTASNSSAADIGVSRLSYAEGFFIGDGASLATRLAMLPERRRRPDSTG